jgi:hypothetical protein
MKRVVSKDCKSAKDLIQALVKDEQECEKLLLYCAEMLFRALAKI